MQNKYYNISSILDTDRLAAAAASSQVTASSKIDQKSIEIR